MLFKEKLARSSSSLLMSFKDERTTENSVKVTFPIKPLFGNSAGIVSSGIISTLADVALSNTVRTVDFCIIHDDQNDVVAKAQAIFFNH